MPSRTRITDVWLIDWDSTVDSNGLQDGTWYTHEHTDISQDVDSYLIRWGADAAADKTDIKLTAAQGTLKLYNRDNRYDPESVNNDIGKSALRVPHKCMLLAVDETPVAGPFTGQLRTRGNVVEITPPTLGDWKVTYKNVEYNLQYFDWRRPASTNRFEFQATPTLPTLFGDDGWGLKINNLTKGRVFYIPMGGQSTVGQTVLQPWLRRGTRFDLDTGWKPVGELDDWVEITIVKYLNVAWEGIAVNGLGSQLTRQNDVEFELLSKGFKYYNEPKPAFERQENTPLSTMLSRRIDPRTATGQRLPMGSTSLVLDDDHSLYDPNLSNLNAQTVGWQIFPDTVPIDNQQRNATGTTELGFINACARFANGWAIENRLGRIGIISWEAALGTDASRTIDHSFKMRRKDGSVDYNREYIRNFAQPYGRFIHTPGTSEIIREFDVTLSLLRGGFNTTEVVNLKDTLGERGKYGAVWDATVESSVKGNAPAGHATLRTVARQGNTPFEYAFSLSHLSSPPTLGL